MGTKNSKSNEGRHAKNGRVKARDGSAEELDRETGEEQTTVGWTRRKDGGWQTTEESGRVTWAGQEETREANAEMGGLSSERCEEGRRGGRLEEEDKRQRRVENTIRWGGEEIAGSTSPLTTGKRGRESVFIYPSDFDMSVNLSRIEIRDLDFSFSGIVRNSDARFVSLIWRRSESWPTVSSVSRLLSSMDCDCFVLRRNRLRFFFVPSAVAINTPVSSVYKLELI